MVGNDPRSEATHHLEEAIELLEAVRSRHLDHTDGATVRDALQGLAVLRRSLSGTVLDGSQIATRLRQVAANVQSCAQRDASLAYSEVIKAAEIFQTLADGT